MNYNALENPQPSAINNEFSDTDDIRKYDNLENDYNEYSNEIELNNIPFVREEEQTEKTKKLEEDSREPLYVMTLELNKNNSANIKIYSDSNPYELAYEFCKNQNLDYKSLNYLAGEIQNLISEYNSKVKSENAAKYVNDVQDEIIELDEEQMTTEKNRYNEEKENLNYKAFNRKDDKSDRKEKEIKEENEILEEEPINYHYTQKQNENNIENIRNSTSEDNSNQVRSSNNRITFEDRENFTFKNQDYDLIGYNDRLNKDSGDGKMNKDINVTTNYKMTKNQNKNSDEINHSEQLANFDSIHKTSDNFVLSTPEHENVEVNYNQIQNSNQTWNSNQNIIKNSKLNLNKDLPKQIENKEKEAIKFNTKENVNDYPYKNLSCQNDKDEYQYENNSNIYCNTNYNLNHKRSSLESNHLNSKITNGKKQTIFDRLYHEAYFKRTRPKHGMYYKTYYSELEMNDKSNQLNTSQGQLVYYKEKLLKEEKSRFSSLVRSEIDPDSSKNLAVISRSKFPSSNFNTISVFENQNDQMIDFNKTIRKSNYIKREISQERLKNHHPIQQIDPDLDVNKAVNTKLFNDQINIPTEAYCNKSRLTKHNLSNCDINSNFLKITKFQPYVNLFKNEEKQKFKKILQIQKIRNQIDNSFTFKPLIENKYQSDLNFLQRQDIYRENSKNKKKEIEEILKHPTDEKGNRLFHPKLNAENKNTYMLNRDGSSKNVFEKNYEYASKYQINKENLKKKYESEQGLHKIEYNEESEELFQVIKEEAFKNLFRILDSDQDNLISSINIGLSFISSDIRRIIDPILVELKEENENLNEREFVIAMGQLYNMLSYHDRIFLINTFKKRYHVNKIEGNSYKFRV